jgi:hypothetical protein
MSNSNHSNANPNANANTNTKTHVADDLFEGARHSLDALAKSFEQGLAEQVAETASASVSEIEKASRALVARLRSRPLKDVERARLLTELRELRRRAYVCAALAESQALYLQWGQESSFMAREYTAAGRIASESAHSAKEWEV